MLPEVLNMPQLEPFQSKLELVVRGVVIWVLGGKVGGFLLKVTRGYFVSC